MLDIHAVRLEVGDQVRVLRYDAHGEYVWVNETFEGAGFAASGAYSYEFVSRPSLSNIPEEP